MSKLLTAQQRRYINDTVADLANNDEALQFIMNKVLKHRFGPRSKVKHKKYDNILLDLPDILDIALKGDNKDVKLESLVTIVDDATLGKQSMTAPLRLSETTLLDNLTASDEIKESLAIMYGGEIKHQRLLASVINSIITHGYFYFSITNDDLVRIIKDDPNRKKDALSGSEIIKFIHFMTQQTSLFKMQLNAKGIHKATNVWILNPKIDYMMAFCHDTAALAIQATINQKRLVEEYINYVAMSYQKD